MRVMGTFMMAALLAGSGIAGAATTTVTPTISDAELAAKLAREIRMYSRYTIWDNVNLRVENGHVELLGEVSQPFKKDDLARLAQRLAGVTGVTNQLKVLPLSPHDDSLRVQVARAVYGDAVLFRYANRANPPIHIVVDNGRVTLEGVVSTEMEKRIAGMRASTAGLSFGPVVNNLRVENPARKG
jgi:hyperosmotically inducible periplasmic protein